MLTLAEGLFINAIKGLLNHLQLQVLAGPLAEEHLALIGSDGKISRVLARIGDKWSVLIVMLLTSRPHRFNEIKRAVGGISQRMLTLTLKGLERDGLVWRRVHPTIPRRVEYGLTELGCSLAEPVRSLGEWARAHTDELDAARARYEALSDR